LSTLLLTDSKLCCRAFRTEHIGLRKGRTHECICLNYLMLRDVEKLCVLAVGFGGKVWGESASRAQNKTGAPGPIALRSHSRRGRRIKKKLGKLGRFQGRRGDQGRKDSGPKKNTIGTTWPDRRHTGSGSKRPTTCQNGCILRNPPTVGAPNTAKNSHVNHPPWHAASYQIWFNGLGKTTVVWVRLPSGPLTLSKPGATQGFRSGQDIEFR